jgi:hypothetical protein
MNLLDYRLNCIEQYLIAGYALFPVSQLKIPLIEEWPALKPNTLINPHSLGVAYGVVLTATDCVIDFDPRRGNQQLTQLIQLLKLDTPIKTFTVRTVSGGIHMYFKKPKNAKYIQRSKEFDAIEVKSKGRFVVGAGSCIDGKVYRITKGKLENRILLVPT